MKKISSAMVKRAVVLLAVFSLIVAANVGYVSSNLKSQKITQMMTSHHMKVIDTSSYRFSFIQMMLQKILFAKKLIQ